MPWFFIGDKAPITISGRLFSVIWIIIGIAGVGILTGGITAKIVTMNSPPTMKMDGKKVGTLRFRDYDSYVVSKSGGQCVYYNGSYDFKSDVRGLLNKLRNDEIDGLLLDKYTLWFVCTMQRYDMMSFTKEEAHFFIHDTLRTEQEVKGDSYSYGLLIRNVEDYNYYKDFIHEKQLREKILWKRWWAQEKNESKGISPLFVYHFCLLGDTPNSTVATVNVNLTLGVGVSQLTL